MLVAMSFSFGIVIEIAIFPNRMQATFHTETSQNPLSSMILS